MTKKNGATAAFDVWVKENRDVIFFIQSKRAFQRIGDQKVRELALTVSGDLFVLTGPVPVMGVCKDGKSNIEALREYPSTRVEVVLEEDPTGEIDPEGLSPRHAFSFTLPVRVSVVV